MCRRNCPHPSSGPFPWLRVVKVQRCVRVRRNLLVLPSSTRRVNAFVGDSAFWEHRSPSHPLLSCWLWQEGARGHWAPRRGQGQPSPAPGLTGHSGSRRAPVAPTARREPARPAPRTGLPAAHGRLQQPQRLPGRAGGATGLRRCRASGACRWQWLRDRGRCPTPARGAGSAGGGSTSSVGLCQGVEDSVCPKKQVSSCVSQSLKSRVFGRSC